MTAAVSGPRARRSNWRALTYLTLLGRRHLRGVTRGGQDGKLCHNLIPSSCGPVTRRITIRRKERDQQQAVPRCLNKSVMGSLFHRLQRPVFTVNLVFRTHFTATRCAKDSTLALPSAREH